jgi:DNA-nicking Smr family endonuclease
MTRRGRGLSDEERGLWDTVTRAITPLRKRKAKIREPNPAAPVMPPVTEKKVRATSMPVAPKPAERPAPPPLAPLERRLKQKLSRGRDEPDARIDLHGMTQADAHAALAHFLRRAQRDGARVVLVITGKGARPGADSHSERGVLKRQVPLWLESSALRTLVIGFENAGAGHGGTGALYVRVRRAR